MGAQGSYVVEADGTNTATEVITTGSDFDFVAHDFGIEATEAIQITLANLSRATNLRGNLLLWSFDATDKPSSEAAAQDGLPYDVAPDTTAMVVTGIAGRSEDYSYYDEGTAGASQNAIGPGAAAVDGGEGGVAVLSGASSGESLAASVKDLPAIDTNAIFWILKPTEFTSFSQMTAARFGFTVGHDQNSN